MARAASLTCLLLLCVVNIHSESEQQSTIDQLWSNLQNLQYKRDTSLIFPFQWTSIKGLWPSFGKVNAHGDWELRALRRTFGVPDNNGFVTAWIVELLLEAHELGSINLNGDPQGVAVITNAVNALKGFKDNNFPGKIPVYDFWGQKLNQYGIWTQYPTNFVEPLSKFKSTEELVRWVLENLGLGDVWNKIQGPTLNFLLQTVVDSFHIPGDYDDTAVHIAMALHLQSVFPSLFDNWWANNNDLAGLSKLWTKYSYQPFSSDANVNSIDPRTYFWIHDFLSLHVGEDLRIITTWTTDLAGNNKTFLKGVRMPFNSNNVDVSVGANGVYAIVSTALLLPTAQAQALLTPELQGMLLNTTSLIAWSIKSGIAISRPDIVLMYYPPVYDFYWFASRSLFSLRSASPAVFEQFPVLAQVRDILQDAFEGAGTQQLLAKKGNDTVNGYSFWDDFLGNGDIINGQPSIGAEDRLFSTSITINAFFEIWTQETPTCPRQWLPNTPPQVLEAVKTGVHFLEDNILAGTYAADNCFFSGSMKGDRSLPFWYPGNSIYQNDGTPVPPVNASKISELLYDTVSGYIPDQQYQKLVGENWFGHATPTDFPGFNGPDAFFPFWSSPSLTYAAALGALSKFQAVSTCAQKMNIFNNHA